jgi:predicted Zn-dependent protease
MFLATALVLNASAHELLEAQITDYTRRLNASTNSTTNSALYRLRGEAYCVHGDFSAAARDFDLAEKLAPAESAVHLLRARLRLDEQQPQKALASINLFLAVRKDSVDGFAVRAKAKKELGDFSGAAEDYSAAIKLSTRSSPEFFLLRAQALNSAGEMYLSQAVSGLDDGIKQLGPVPSLMQYALELELRLKAFDSALRRLDQIATQTPRQESCWFQRGEILRQAGRLQEARVAYQSATDALQKLPERLRNSRAMQVLQTRIQEGLQALDAQKP